MKETIAANKDNDTYYEIDQKWLENNKDVVDALLNKNWEKALDGTSDTEYFSFEYEGMAISNPLMDETGRFPLTLKQSIEKYGEQNVMSLLKGLIEEDTKRRNQMYLKLDDLGAGESTTFCNYPRKGVDLKFCKDENYDMVTFSVIIDGKDVASSYDIHLDDLDLSEIEDGTFNELVDEKITLGEFLNDYEKKKEIERN